MGIRRVLGILFVVLCIAVLIVPFQEIYANDYEREICENQLNCFLPDDVNEGKEAISMYEGNPYMRAKATLDHIIRVPWKITRKSDGYWWKWSDYTMIKYQGNIGYCIEPSVVIASNANYSPVEFSTYFSQSVRDRIMLYMTYGYTYPNHQTDLYYLATQKLIWEAIGGYTIKFYAMNSNFTGNLDLTSETNEIKRLVANHSKTPSFHQTSIQLKVGESITISDEEGVIQDYVIRHIPDYVAVEKNGNTVVIKALSRGSNDSIQFQHGSDKVEDAVVQAYRASGSQTFVTIPDGVVEPLFSSLRVDVTGFGDLTLQKQNQNGVNQGAGFVFAFSYQKDMQPLIGEYTTDVNGQIILDKLDEGTVYYQEIAVPDSEYTYTMDSAIKEVTVVADKMTTFEVENEQSGHVKLLKRDRDSLKELRGVQFVFSEYEDLSNPLGTYMTDENGEIWIRNVLPKTYYYQEVQTVSPYVLDTQIGSVVVKAGETSYINAYNEQQVASLTITKKDRESESLTQGSATLKGAEYVLLDDQQQVVRTIVSKEDAVLVEDIPLGTYYLKETKAPQGMYLNTELIPLVFSYSNQQEKVHAYQVDVYDEVTVTEIRKIDEEGHGLANARLRIVDKNQRVMDQWVSTEEAHVIKGLTVGETYVLQEEQAPVGYLLSNDVTFVVEEGKPTQVTMVNALEKLTFRIVKKDRITDETIVNHPFSFGLYDDEECTQRIQEARANVKKGRIEFVIPYGTYYVKELNAPKGYMLSDDVLQVDFNESGVFVNGEWLLAEDNMAIYSFYDWPLPMLVITKKDVETGSLAQGFASLQGAEYDLYADDQKTIIEHLAFEEDYVIVENIPVGVYYLKETKAPAGMQIHKDFIEVILSYAARTNSREFEVDVYDAVSQTEIVKVDAKSQLLENAHLQVLDKNQNVLEEWISTNQAHVIKGLTVNETYVLHEVRAPNGYQVANDVWFTVVDGDVTKVKMVNEPKEITMCIQKVDQSTNQIIYDRAVFGLFVDGICIEEVSTQDGFCDFTLTFGEYEIKERSAPSGYRQSEEVVKIEYSDEGVYINGVKASGDWVEYVFYNQKSSVVSTADTGHGLWIGVAIVSLMMALVLFIKKMG